MAELTTTVKIDRNADFTYELDITSKDMDVQIRRGRQTDSSQPPAGSCDILVNNNAGDYTALGAGTPLRPMHGIQVIVDSQKLFTGFIERTRLHPDGNKQRIKLECADWLWILSRTDVSLPMMLNVRSDNLASRIADLAEIGEIVENTRFKDDKDGYLARAGATNTRVTTGALLEGLAAMTTLTTAQLDGWKFEINSEIGNKVTASVYVKAESSSDAGNDVRLRIVGASSGTSATLTLTEEYQRLTVTNQSVGGDVFLDIQLLQDDAGGGFTFRTGAVHAVLFKNAIPRSFDTGQSYFSHVAPRRTNALRAIQEVANNELGGLVYVNGSGVLVFEDRHHRWRVTASRVSQGTIDETMVDVPYEEDAEDLIGEVELGFVKWIEGATPTQEYSEDEVPIAVPPNGTITLYGDYGAMLKDTIVPVANTDYFIRSLPGAGNDETGNVTLSFEDFGGGFKVVFTSSVGRVTYLTSFAIRGTPVRLIANSPQEVYTPSGAPDYASKLRYNFRLATSQPDVAAWAEYLGLRYVTQRERLPVKLLNKTTAILAEMTDRVISERVTITNDNAAYSSKVNGPYYIDSVQHHLSQGKTKMETAWGVVPADNKFWILGTGELGDDQSQTTTTALAA